MLLGSILLEPEQEGLLCKFVEAERSVPRDQRGKFLAIGTRGLFVHTMVGGIEIIGNITDAEILAEKGLLGKFLSSRGDSLFYIMPEGFQYYRELKQVGQLSERIEEEIRGYLGSDEFVEKYPAAFKKISEAERLLWESDSRSQFTTVGHLCREALQKFGEALVLKHKPPEVDPDKTHTANRISAVLQSSPSLGSTEREFLKVLVDYWHSVSKLVQRQEHGSQREKSNLTWEDTRRVVFQTLIVMYEVDRSLPQGV